MRELSLAIIAGILLASPIQGAPLEDVAVSPLPGPASCYAGTPGTDHVIFLKSKTSQADCDILGGRSPCLARREFAGDGANGRPVSLLAAIVVRPSVTGAGDFVAFTEFGFNVCLMATASEDAEGCVGRDLFGVDPHSISINPAGTELALTQLDGFTFEPTRFIAIVDPNTFALLEPIFQVSIAGPGGTALEVESVDFTVDGDYLVFDARNPVTGLWGIYAVSRSTAVTTMLVAPVPGLAIKNPALAQTSDDYMVFDAQDTTTGVNVVFAANLLTGELSQVAATSIQGAPSYTGDDRAVVFNELDNSVSTLSSLDIQPLADDRLTPAGVRTRWLNDGAVPAIYRRGTWDGTLLDPLVCAPGSDEDSDGDGVPDNQDAFPNDPTEWDDTDNDGVGDNGDAFPNDPGETTDTDGDNIGNNADPDDDNDGVLDADDDYPLGRFDDARPDHWAFTFIEALARAGVTAGCGGANYCPNAPVTRAQMAVFLERGMRGSGYSPPAPTGNVFLDVGVADFAASFIEQLLQDGITAGCGNGNYCPNATVTRDQMAVFLLRAMHGAGYSPPPATGMFLDVPLDHWAARWIEQLAAEGITAGCGNGNYCPAAPVTRDQMAVFLVRAFGL